MADHCADEIMRTVRALYARLPVGVEASRVAARIGASVQSVAQRMVTLAESGALRRLYTASGHRSGPTLYVPAEVSRD